MGTDQEGAAVQLIVWIFSLAICGVALMASMSTITDERVIEAAENSGLHDVKVGGWDMGACSDSDVNGREVYGVRADGVEVEAVVCCGVWKRCTVRW